jgi:hypothetical protein
MSERFIGLECEINTLASSAYRIGINSSGPSTDLCKTPFVTLVHPEYTLVLFNPMSSSLKSIL